MVISYGLVLPGRSYNNTAYSTTNAYRYGFNAKELDKSDEFGSLTHYDYGFRIYNPSIGRFLSVDPLTHKMPGHSPYCYTLNNPIRMIDPDGRFPITPEFRKNYPQLSNFIETRLQGYIQNSQRMSSTLLKYSTGNLTSSQISSDFKPNSGPTISSHDFLANPNQSGEYDYNSNTIKLSNTALSRFEKILGSSDSDKQKWGEMDFTRLFVNEYTHYGDALDGLDAVKE
jgi:RHS repeat-associated protein